LLLGERLKVGEQLLTLHAHTQPAALRVSYSADAGVAPLMVMGTAHQEPVPGVTDRDPAGP
jgi:hypothetical protein